MYHALFLNALQVQSHLTLKTTLKKEITIFHHLSADEETDTQKV